MEKVYSSETIKAAKLAQEGKIKEACIAMAVSTCCPKFKVKDVAHIFEQYMTSALHRNCEYDCDFMENMFHELLIVVLAVLKKN